MRQTVRAMRDAVQISSRLIRKRVLDIYCSSFCNLSATHSESCSDQSSIHFATFPHNPTSSNMLSRACDKQMSKDQAQASLTVFVGCDISAPLQSSSRLSQTLPISHNQPYQFQSASECPNMSKQQPLKTSVDAHGLSSDSGCSRIPLTSN